MPRHIIDASQTRRDAARLLRFLRLDRRSAAPVTAVWARAPRYRPTANRLGAFVRVDRTGPGRI